MDTLLDANARKEIADLFFIRGLYQKNPTNIFEAIRIAELHGYRAVVNLEAHIGDVEATNTITNSRTMVGHTAIEAINNLKPYHHDLLLNGRRVGLFDLFFHRKELRNHE